MTVNQPGTGAAIDQRCFDLLFNQFSSGMNDINSKDSFMRNKRLISMVDRRSDDDKDKVFMYEPPENCRNIPRNSLPEWYIGASRMCLLPDIPKAQGADDDQKDPNSPESLVNGIGAKNGCRGQVLTLSFHVREVDEIKMYLYCHGQFLRFYPEDVK